MRFSEFQNDLYHFKVTVRVKNGSGSMTVRTMVSAESIAQAQFLSRHIFGRDAVLSVSQSNVHEDMSEGSKVLSPQELQVKSLADQAKRLNNQAKLTKARNSLNKAKKNYNKSLSVAVE